MTPFDIYKKKISDIFGLWMVTKILKPIGF